MHQAADIANTRHGFDMLKKEKDTLERFWLAPDEIMLFKTVYV